VEIHTHFSKKQRVFLDFALSHCISDGVEQLHQDKLTPLWRLRCHNSTQDAAADLGSNVGKAFAGFQKHLYQDVA
jgi:type I restriction enzyme, R subunit